MNIFRLYFAQKQAEKKEEIVNDGKVMTTGLHLRYDGKPLISFMAHILGLILWLSSFYYSLADEYIKQEVAKTGDPKQIDKLRADFTAAFLFEIAGITIMSGMSSVEQFKVSAQAIDDEVKRILSEGKKNG